MRGWWSTQEIIVIETRQHVFIWVPQNQALGQILKCKQFIWQVIPGKNSRGVGEPDREGKESGKRCIIAEGQQELNSPGALQPTQNTSLGVKKVLVYLSPGSLSVRARDCFWGGSINSLALSACCAWEQSGCLQLEKALGQRNLGASI